MARSRRNQSNGRQSRGSRAGMAGADAGGAMSGGMAGDAGGVETTGRWLVAFREDATEAGIQALTEGPGFQVFNALEFDDEEGGADAVGEDGAVVFDKLGVAVVNTPPDRFGALNVMAADSDAILAIEPERVVYAIETVTVDRGVAAPNPPPAVPSPPALTLDAGTFPADYLRGYRDGVVGLIDQLLGPEDGAISALGSPLGAVDESVFTWGLQATKVNQSKFSGAGVRVAVLDTGFDRQHPDFAGRRVTARSFVPGESDQDGHGHGTHVIGTACGPERPGQLPRYGVAFGADIFAGKVLSNAGSGSDGGILDGINWAITNGCAIVSMSLGAPLCGPGQAVAFSQVFEQVAQRALAQGTLIIAAAGNDSERPQLVCPVSHPANCPSILAVAAIDVRDRIAFFSNGGINPNGGQVDIAGPGVDVRSSWPTPTLYRTIDGTSMATPHVAGIAALFAEANPGVSGRGLISLLIQHARRMTLPGRDVGAGLVQAP